jgi:hypothetical protein
MAVNPIPRVANYFVDATNGAQEEERRREDRGAKDKTSKKGQKLSTDSDPAASNAQLPEINELHPELSSQIVDSAKAIELLTHESPVSPAKQLTFKRWSSASKKIANNGGKRLNKSF